MTSLMERAQRTAPTAAQLAAQRAANAIAAASNQLSSSWNRAFSKDGYIISDGSALALTRAKLAFWILSMIIVLGCFVLSRWFFRWARKNEYSPWSYIAAASTTVIFLVLKIVHWHIGARNSLASAGLDAVSVLILVAYLVFTILGLWILFNVSAGFSGKVGKIILVALLVILAIVQVGISIRYYVLYSSYRGTVNRINTTIETQRQNDMVRQLSYLSYAGNSLGLTYQLIAMLSGLGLMLYCDRQARTVWTYIALLSYSIFFAVRAASSGISVAMYTLWRGNALYIATPGAYTYIQVSEFLGWFLWATTLALIAVAAAKAGDYEDYEEEEEPKQA